MIEAIGPDGMVHEFPDGTPREVIDGIMKKNILEAPQIVQEKPLAEMDLPSAPVDDSLLNKPTRDEMLRNTLVGGMGTIGGVIGAGMGPAGAVAGGAMGAAAGEAAFQGIQEKPPLEVLDAALDEGKTDLMFSMGISALRPTAQLLGLARRKALGVGEEEMSRVMEAQKLGVDLSPTDVSKFSYINKASKVIGRFPIIGDPFKKAGLRKAGQVVEAEKRLMHRLGPSVNLAELGVDINNAAKTTFKGFREEANRLYKEVRRIADEAGEVIPTNSIKQISAEVLESAELAKAGRKQTVINPLLNVLETAKDLPDKITGSQLDDFLTDLDVAIASARSDGFDISRGLSVKKAAEMDLRNSDVPALAEAIKEADDFYARGMRTFETPTGQKFGKAEKNLFKVKLSKPGTLNPDELFRATFNTKSPRAMSDLRDLVGNEVFNKTVKSHIENAFNVSRNIRKESRKNVDIFNPDKFIKKLGLDDVKSQEYAAMQEALKYTDISIDDLTKFAQVATDAFSTELPDMSTFAARRAVLGGIKSGLAAASGMALASGNVPITSAVIFTLAARKASEILSNPKTLKLATLALDQEADIALRRTAALRLMRIAAENEPEEEQLTRRGTR